MYDPDQIGSLFFFLFLGLSLVIAVLGLSVCIRLLDEGRLPPRKNPLLATLLLLACFCALSFLSVFMPFLALFPAAWYCIGGLWLAFHRGKVNRDGSIVVLLVGLHWIFLTAIQLAFEAWQKSIVGAAIRVDIVLTVPLASLSAILGWTLLDRMPVDPNWAYPRKPVSRRRGWSKEFQELAGSAPDFPDPKEPPSAAKITGSERKA